MKFSFLLLLMFAFQGLAQESAPEKIAFAKQDIRVGSHRLNVELADTSKKVARGLMFRTKPLRSDQGMLFVFTDERPRRFWMKNTFIPLSIGFFDAKKRLVYTTEMQPVRSEMQKPRTYPSGGKSAKYALEVAPGWFQKKKIKLGAKLQF